MAGHEQRMGVLAGQISAAVRTATNPDAAAVEISAAHRAARADIDAAEAERDQAIGVAREAARAAQESQERTDLAEVAAEEALAELDAPNTPATRRSVSATTWPPPKPSCARSATPPTRTPRVCRRSGTAPANAWRPPPVS